MIVKLFETENETTEFISKVQAYMSVAIETVSNDELNSLSETICKKYGISTVWVKWSTVPIKSKLIIASNPYLKDYICLNPESFSYSGFDIDNISKHIEHQVQHFVNIRINNSFAHKEDSIKIDDWFEGVNKRYIYQCSCGFVTGAINRKETLRAKFLRKPICCGSEYYFHDNENYKRAS